MYAVGMLGSYLTQGVYAVAGPFQPFGGAVDIIVVQQEDGSFKSSPWYVKFGDFQGVFKWREKIVDIAVNDVPADFHMFLDNKGEAYFEKEVESDEGMCLALLGASSSTGEDRADGETETLADVQAIVNASSLPPEAIRSKTQSTSPEQNGIVDCGFCPEEKSTTEEGKLEMQEPSRDSNVVPEEDRGLSNMSSQAGLETPIHLKTESSHLEQNGVMGCGICPEAKSTTEKEMVETKEPFSDSNGGLQEERRFLSMSAQAGLETPKVFRTSYGPEALRTQNEIDHMHEVGASNSLTMKIENDVIFSAGTSFTNIGVVETARSNTEDNISQSSTILTAEEGSCLEAAVFTGAEVVNGSNSDAKVDIEDDRLLVDVGTEEGIEVNGEYKNGYKSSDEDEVFHRLECIKIEGERETHVCTGGESTNNDVLDGVGINEATKDCLVWNSESPLNQDLCDVAIEISHNTAFLLEEKHGGTKDESAALEKEIICKVNESDEGNTTDGAASEATCVSISSSPSRWRLWPFWFRKSSIEKGSLSTSSVSEQALLAAANVAIGSPFTEELLQNNGFYKWQQKAKVRTYVPTSAQLASLKLKDGPNKVTFTFSTVLGKTEVDARIYLWKWNTRIVISDVDGTITKSDVLGQVMPLVGRDWSQYGVTRLFSAIKDNGFEVLFLSARAISQAYLTRRFLLNLKQDGEALPEGPVFISPDGLIPSLYREVIRRAPHEFKISCLEEIRQLFPKDVNPFYAGFGNRETDEISYLKVGIPKGKIFIINPKGEVVVNHRVDCKSYPSLHALVDDMFPPMSSHEQEDFNAWNYWKIPLPDIEDELSMLGSKNAKKVSSSKK